MNLKYNESLSKVRNLLENKGLPYSNNIMFLYIDSVSRTSSIKQLKKTLSIFESSLFHIIMDMSKNIPNKNVIFFNFLNMFILIYLKVNKVYMKNHFDCYSKI